MTDSSTHYSCNRLGEVVCDRNLLQVVMSNLFANAIKYSLPRYKGELMVIEVIGQPQNKMSIIEIKNWGLGIPEDEFDRIFNLFVRGSVLDTKKARRGMGFGLYLARTILKAHKGNVICKYSKFTLNDEERRMKWEGFENSFEIRIPHTVEEGIIEYRVER